MSVSLLERIQRNSAERDQLNYEVNKEIQASCTRIKNHLLQIHRELDKVSSLAGPLARTPILIINGHESSVPWINEESKVKMKV